MSQHFLMSSGSRTLSLSRIARMSEGEARAMFHRLRWPETDGAPVCPRCETHNPYLLKSRQIFKCRACKHQFSTTSGSIFASRKMSFKDHLFAVALFIGSNRGKSSLQLSQETDVQYRTALAFTHKLRRAMAKAQAGFVLSGNVELDGAFIGGHFVVANQARPGGKRLIKGAYHNRRVVVVARERNGRAIAFCGKRESDALDWARSHIAPGSTIICDEAHAWDSLFRLYALIRIRHKEHYSFEGQSTNWAESFHARLRRHHNTHGQMSAGYLPLYAAEIAWRENTRRMDSRARFEDLFRLCFARAGIEQRSINPACHVA